MGVLRKSLRSVSLPIWIPLHMLCNGWVINVTAATVRREQLLEALFSIFFVSYERKVGDYFFPELLL
jgi:hypothetical protein